MSILLLIAGSLILVSPSLAALVNIKRNSRLALGCDVDDFQISLDSSRVVYLADQDTDEVWELYSVPLAGGSAVKLNGPLVCGGDVENFEISPDSSRVVYRADQDTNGEYELYSVPLAGGSVVKLNGPLVSGDGVSNDFQISPDSSRVVYRADQETMANELYSVPLAGGSVVKLNGPLVSGGDVWEFQISPDSSRVVYRADQDTNEMWELYSVPLAGGSVVKLNGPLVRGGDVVKSDFQVSPDSSGVVYLADQDIDNVMELYVSYDSVSVTLPITTVVGTTFGGTITDTGDLTTTIEVPAAAVTDTTTIVYISLPAISGAPSPFFAFAGHAFSLEAYRNDVLLPGFTFEKSVTVTIEYSDGHVKGLTEDTLTLYSWDGNAWAEAACGDYERNLEANVIRVPLCHLSDFALFGEMEAVMYLPIIEKDYSP